MAVAFQIDAFQGDAFQGTPPVGDPGYPVHIRPRVSVVAGPSVAFFDRRPSRVSVYAHPLVTTAIVHGPSVVVVDRRPLVTFPENA